jgi:hypothetical protein
LDVFPVPIDSTIRFKLVHSQLHSTTAWEHSRFFDCWRSQTFQQLLCLECCPWLSRHSRPRECWRGCLYVVQSELERTSIRPGCNVSLDPGSRPGLIARLGGES